MTQAINLANFSNSLDSSGGVPPTQLNSVVPISKGGTNASTAAAARTNLGLAIGTDVAAQAYAFPSGGIIMWSGSVGSIPSGWLLCNGASGTPDLRDRFIVGAGSGYSPGNTGGTADAVVVSHSHSASSSFSGNTLPAHSHTTTNTYYSPDAAAGTFYRGGTANFTSANGVSSVSAGTPSGSVSTSITASGVSGANANLPPYYALAFIMKS